MLTGLSLELRIALSTSLSLPANVVWTWTREYGYWAYTERIEAVGPSEQGVWVMENRPGWMRPFYTLTDINAADTISSGDAAWYLLNVAIADVPPPIPEE